MYYIELAINKHGNNNPYTPTLAAAARLETLLKRLSDSVVLPNMQMFAEANAVGAELAELTTFLGTAADGLEQDAEHHANAAWHPVPLRPAEATDDMITSKQASDAIVWLCKQSASQRKLAGDIRAVKSTLQRIARKLAAKDKRVRQELTSAFVVEASHRLWSLLHELHNATVPAWDHYVNHASATLGGQFVDALWQGPPPFVEP